MTKSLKAALLGYILFRVNEKYFLSYSNAQAARRAVPDEEPVSFTGLNIFRMRWEGFYLRGLCYLAEELQVFYITGEKE